MTPPLSSRNFGRTLGSLGLITLAVACSNPGYASNAATGTGKHPVASVTSSSQGATGGTSTASSGSSSSTGAASTGTSGSSTSGTLPSCDAGIQVAWQAESLCAMSPLGAGVVVTNFLDVSQTASTDSDGDFYFCLDAGTPLAFSVAQSGFLTSVSEVIVANVSETLRGTELITYCNSVSQDIYAALATATPPFDDNLAVAAVIIDSQGVCSRAGWQINLTLPDGGPLLGTGVAYFSGTDVDPTALATSVEGGSLVYNIDPTLERVAISAVLVDGGGGNSCTYVGAQPPFQLTGLLPIQGPGSISFGIYPIP